ncbi:MAG: hypothetical protein ACTSPB_16610 [Candidatus Thorarchaeota archaeon]
MKIGLKVWRGDHIYAEWYINGKPAKEADKEVVEKINKAIQ